MVRMPPEFVATKYPGYFWNTATQRLFTAKLGVLYELKYVGPNRWNHGVEGYRVSDKGVRKTLTLKYLRTLKPESDSVFPTEYQLTVGEQGYTDEAVLNLGLLPKGTKITVRIR